MRNVCMQLNAGNSNYKEIIYISRALVRRQRWVFNRYSQNACRAITYLVVIDGMGEFYFYSISYNSIFCSSARPITVL